MTSTPPRIMGLKLLLLITALVYLPALQAGLVWDDQALVVGNTLTGRRELLWEAFRVDLWVTSSTQEPSGYYRPLMLLSLGLDRLLWGLSPLGAHLQSLLWHLLVVSLSYQLFLAHLDRLRAWTGAAFVALHPVFSEAVIWVVARNDLMAAALSLGSLLCLSRPRPRLLGGGLLATAAVLSKESAALLPVALWLLPSLHEQARSARLACAAGVGAALCMRATAGIEAPPLEGPGLPLFLERLPEFCALLAQRIVWPWPLSATDSLEYLPELTWLSAGCLLLLSLGALLTLARGDRLSRAGLGWALLFASPALLAVLSRGAMGERYLYLPGVGIALAMASALPRRALWGGLLVLPVWIAVISWRLPHWQSGVSLFAASATYQPNAFAFANLGHEHNRSGEPLEASRWFQRALQEPSPFLDVCPHAVRAPLRAGWPCVALDAARLGQERGCPGSALQRGLHASAAAQCASWEEAESLLGWEPEALDQRGRVVLTAIHLRRGWPLPESLKDDKWREAAVRLLAASEASR